MAKKSNKHGTFDKLQNMRANALPGPAVDAEPNANSASEPAAAEHTAPGPGDLVAGRYQLRRLLQASADADIFAATDLRLGAPRAVKLLRLPSARERRKTALTRLANAAHRGARVAASCCCVPVLDAVLEPHADDPPFLVMPLVDGIRLADLLETHFLDYSRIHAILSGAAHAVADAQSFSILHLDLHPSNLLIVPNGAFNGDDRDNRDTDGGVTHWVRLLDFSTARRAHDDATPTTPPLNPYYRTPRGAGGSPHSRTVISNS